MVLGKGKLAMTNVALIGAGGHSKVVQDIVRVNDDLTLYAVLDQNIKKKKVVDGVIHAHTDMIGDLVSNCKFCIAIGNNQVRQKLIEEFTFSSEKYVTLIHPTAVISPSATIGRGTVIMPNAVINANSVVGNHCIVNSGAVIEHDNRIRDYVHVSPNATLAGTVTISKGTHVGSGATVIPGRKIGIWSVVGAGAVVTSDVSDEVTVVGVPARET